MLYDIITVFICMFAAMGVVFFILELSLLLSNKKHGYKFYILCENLSGKEAEYAIRYIENIILSRLGGVGCGIKLGENVEIDKAVLEALKREYRNIE